MFRRESDCTSLLVVLGISEGTQEETFVETFGKKACFVFDVQVGLFDLGLVFCLSTNCPVEISLGFC